jgi:glutaconate CoA-transferase subunit A
MAEWISPREAAELVNDGAKLALGGSHRMAPMALVRALVGRGLSRLHLITTPTAGFGAELLAAAGALETVETAQVSLGELGLAPAFRKGAEEGRFKVLDAS